MINLSRVNVTMTTHSPTVFGSVPPVVSEGAFSLNPSTVDLPNREVEPKAADCQSAEFNLNSNHCIDLETVTSPSAKWLPETSSSSDVASTVSFHDIYYEVMTKLTPCSFTSTKKEILIDIHGIFEPGMNAIMGPTGSGKTSLLDVLAGRKAPEGLNGTILLDGKPVPENFKLLVGYVAQDDVLTGALTIRENFAFSAALRLSQKISQKERNRRIDQIISELGLSDVADTKVGNEFIRGVSGGERKRCNIGMELIISPPLLFIDEPTTGLDASTANAIMMQLRKLAMNGRNIIFSIHQPRYSIFRLFDSLMLLSHGSVVYHGPSEEAIDYFSSVGYVCDRFNNPADFFLDIINGDSSAVTSNLETENVVESKECDPLVLNKKYKSSTCWERMNERIKPIIDEYKRDMDTQTIVHFKKINYKTSFLTQLRVVSGRAIRSLSRDPVVYTLQFAVSIIFALIVGGIYFQLSDSRASAIQNRAGAFFFIILNQIFGNMSAVELFIKERSLFIHENTNGYYRVSAYFLAKVFCDIIPLRFIPCMIFSAIAYYMIGFQSGFESFLLFTLTIFLTALSASSLSFLISSSVKVFAVANLSLALCYIFMMLFSGLLVNVGDLGDWVSWLKYFSIFRYGLNALSIIELKDQRFCGNASTSEVVPQCIPIGNVTCAYGNAYLEVQNIPFETEWDLWANIVALGSLTFGFLFLAHIQLLRVKKLK